MSVTDEPEDFEGDPGQTRTTIREDRPGTAPDSSEEESERIKRRLGAALTIPLASLVVLAIFVVATSRVFIEAQHIGGLLAPLIAMLVAGGILAIAWRGWFQHDPRISFTRLIGGIIAVGVVLIAGSLWLLRLNSSAGADLPAGTLAVVAREYEFLAKSWSAPEGEVTINYESGGKIGHTLTIEGRERDLLLKVSPSAPMDSGSILLDEGVYTVYCDLKGHRELGMEATLEITEGPEERTEGPEERPKGPEERPKGPEGGDD